MPTRPAGPAPYRKPLQPNRVPVLDDLRIGNARVGHVRMHRISTITLGRRPTPATDGLVVTELIVAEQHIVHRALTGSAKAQGLEQCSHETLTGLDVSAADRRGSRRIITKVRIQHAVRDAKRHGLHDPFVERQRFADQHPQDIDHGAVNDCRRGVEIAGMYFS